MLCSTNPVISTKKPLIAIAGNQRVPTKRHSFLIILLILLFGGGGYYAGGPGYGGGGLGLVLVICLVMYLMGSFRRRT